MSSEAFGASAIEKVLPVGVAVRVEAISKCYHIYATPRDRLRQFVFPPIQRFFRRSGGRYFDERWALRGVSFEVRKGEIVGIVGKNGSGKSTLLQIICGTLSPTDGRVETEGRVAALLELGSGFNPEFTGRENVYLNAAVLGLKKNEIDERFESIAEFAEIGTYIEQPVKTYSSGMVLRLAFAVAISVDPDVLIVDEALAVGDERFQRKCFSRIHGIRERGGTILFVSHSGSTIVELCDRAVLIADGELLTEGSPKRVVAQYQKLLYAPADAIALIRGEISGSRDTTPVVVNHEPTLLDPSGPIAYEVMEQLDIHLKPTSTVEYESRGAKILSPELRTADGRVVNVLVGGRRYRYCYSVEFTKTARDVKFGMLIKTTSGVELGGGSVSRHSDGLVVAEAGSSRSVGFEFCCSLNPGVYFLNAGVLGSVDGDDETHLHRVIDVAMFRVIRGGLSIATGIVDFQVSEKHVIA